MSVRIIILAAPLLDYKDFSRTIKQKRKLLNSDCVGLALDLSSSQMMA